MRAPHWTGVAGVVLSGVLLAGGIGRGAEPGKKLGPDPKEWQQVVDKAAGYLKTTQADDGSWSRGKSPGVSGIVVTALLHSGKTPQDPVVDRGLKYIESLVNAKAGHIAGKDPKPQLLNYVTSVNVMALVAANRDDRYKAVIGDATKFLKKLQWDEDEGKSKDDDFFGGAGYDSQSRPDLSNTQIFLDALKDAGVPPDDPAYKKALVFVSRCQNLKSEDNKMPWAGKINDGSFIYSAANGGATKVEGGSAEAGFPGYGSMTYAGIKSMIYCGVSKDDERIKKAYAWIQKHYTLDANPGMPKFAAHRGLYYYYHTMAKCLDAMGVDEVVDAEGKKHDWRAEITEALAKRQRSDGSWVNDKDQWMEGDPNLVTGYALLALSYCKPK
jgi:squalene-hopene/tetraprenyl-beta-curcumene cyclase